MRYTHVVFDIDGTLLETDEAVLGALSDLILARQGKTTRREELYFVKGIPGWVIFEQLRFPKEDYETLRQDWESRTRARNDCIFVYDGMEKALEQLRASGVHLGIATSKTRDQYRQDFCRFEIARFFDYAVTCEDTDDPKPGAGPLRVYMQETGAMPDQVLYIGDSIYDAMTAKAAGVDFALAMWGTTDTGIETPIRPQTPQAFATWILEEPAK